jgi:hypothetical protein
MPPPRPPHTHPPRQVQSCEVRGTLALLLAQGSEAQTEARKNIKFHMLPSNGLLHGYRALSDFEFHALMPSGTVRSVDCPVD